MSQVFLRTLFFVFLTYACTGFGAEEEGNAAASSEKLRPRTPTETSIDIDETFKLGPQIVAIRTTFINWAGNNKVPFAQLAFLENHLPNLKAQKDSLGFVEGLKIFWITNSLPPLSDEMEEAVKLYLSLPTIPLFTSMLDDCLALFDASSPDSEILETLKTFQYNSVPSLATIEKKPSRIEAWV